MSKVTEIKGEVAGGVIPRNISVFMGNTTSLMGFLTHMSHEKNPPTFYYTGWLIGIFIMVYYNALYNWIVFHPLYIPGTQMTQPTNLSVFFSLLICSMYGISLPEATKTTKPTRLFTGLNFFIDCPRGVERSNGDSYRGCISHTIHGTGIFTYMNG